MNHAITIGDVMMASGIALGAIGVLGIVVGVLWFMAKGWDH